MSRFSHLEFGDDPPRGTESSTGPSQPDAPEPLRDHQHHLAQARRAFNRADFEGALRHFARAIDDHPADPTAWSGQARALVEMGDFVGARDWAGRGLDLHPGDAELAAARAVALVRLGEKEEALALSDTAAESAPPTAFVWLARADVLLGAGFPNDAAIHCLREAVASPASPEGQVEWLAGRIAMAHNRPAVAQTFLQHSLARDAARFPAWSDLGECLAALGQRAEAEAAFRRGLELQPDFAPARDGLTRLAAAGVAGRFSSFWRRILGS